MGWYTDMGNTLGVSSLGRKTGNLLGDVFGSRQELQGQRSARDVMNRAASSSLSDLNTGYKEATAFQQPYMEAGTNALGQMQDQSQFDYGQFNPAEFNPNIDVRQDPGYQFRMQQGNRAMLGSLAKGAGGAYSPDAMRQMMQYNQGQGAQEYGAAYERAKGAYDTNYTRAKDVFDYHSKNLADKWNRLEALRSGGQLAATNQATMRNDLAANRSNVNMQRANANSQYLTNTANIKGAIPGNILNTVGQVVGTAATVAAL